MVRSIVITDDLIHHFYHIYADGKWQEPVNEHFYAASKYHLLGALSSLQIGLVGSLANRASVIAYLDQTGLIYDIVDEQNTGWEQVTQNKLWEFSKHHDGLVFYAHTKSAHNPTYPNIPWRTSMCYYNVVRWRDCVRELDDHDAVGIHWIQSGSPEHKNHNGFFGGTYWWSHLSYIRELPLPDQSHRWGAEGWIGTNEHVPEIGIKVKDFNPGPPGNYWEHGF